MKKVMRSAAGIAAVALLASGCGSGGTNSSNVNPQGAITPHPITWLLSRPADGAVIKTMETLAGQYAQTHPGFKLNLITTPDRPSYLQKYETLAAANQLPELFDTDATPFAQKLAKQGRMMNVDALLKDLGLYNEYRPAALNYQRFDDGSLYMIPFEYGAEVFWYNKALFKKAGIQVPTTLDDFPAMCTALHNAGISVPIALDGQDGWPLERYMAYQPFRAAGESYIQKLKSGAAKFSDAPGQKAVTWMSDLGKANCFESGWSSVGYSDAQALFTSGKAAVYGIGTWELSNLATTALDPTVRKDVDFFTLPTEPGSVTGANDYVAPSGIGMAVNAQKYDPLVRDFLKFALTKYATVYAASGSLGPTNVQPTIPNTATPLYSKAVSTANHVGSQLAMPWDTQLDPTTNTLLGQELVLLVQGNTTPAQFTSTMDTALQQNAPKYFQ